MAVAPPRSYLADLNEAQREAVLTTEGPLLVVAGAGSGKTRVLTYRVAHLIHACGVKPNEILAITFTNKAAGEMRERLQAMLGVTARAIWILTFHAACGRILRREAERLGYRSTFTIYDDQDQVRLTKACLEELGKDPKRFSPRGIHHQISQAKNQLVSPEQYLSRVASFWDQTVAETYELYQRKLHASNAVDFDDLIMLTVEVLERFPDALARWQKAFRYILVDEYQDTNHAQYRLLQLLGGEHGNVCAVGDPDQCLVAGTIITMADGTRRPIEQNTARRRGALLPRERRVRSGDGRSGRTVRTSVHGVAITTAAGRTNRVYARARALRRVQDGLDAAAPHDLPHVEARRTDSASEPLGRTPTAETSRLPVRRSRMNHEHADAAWVAFTHESDAEARAAGESLMSLGVSAADDCRSSRARTAGEGRSLRREPITHRRGVRDTRHRDGSAVDCLEDERAELRASALQRGDDDERRRRTRRH